MDSFQNASEKILAVLIFVDDGKGQLCYNINLNYRGLNFHGTELTCENRENLHPAKISCYNYGGKILDILEITTQLISV